MVLELGNDNLIALANQRITKTASQHIETVGSAFGEDNLFGGLGVNELGDFLARLLVFLRCHLAEVVHAAVDIGIPMAVCLSNSVYHRLWFLRRGSIIQIHQCAIVHLLA